jgi:phospholipase/carboxylesterase
MTVPSQPLSLTHLAQEPHAAPVSGEKPPLLLLLHGVRSNEQDLMGLAPYLDPRFFIVSARAPMVLGPGQFGWYPVAFTPEGPVGDPEQARASRDTLTRFIAEAVRAYGADAERVYLMGFSQGAIMSLYIALTEPTVAAGIVLMSGRLLPEAWEERADDDALRGLPITAVHGKYDQVLPIGEGRAIRDRLTTLPVDLTYREYDMGHEVSPESLSAVTQWLTERLDRRA